MAVLQISRVQHRRGLQQDLPQLSSAELGWSIDQRRLFIGNGTTEEGAPIEGVTEILTQHTDFIGIIKNYIYKGNELSLPPGGEVETGPTASAPTVRYMQDKFDDIVSVRDFGAKGDGVTNNYDAITRAITQILKSPNTISNTRTRKTIYFPAGTYNISGGTILIPPWLRITGDGIDSTFIVQTDATQTCLMQTCDSARRIAPTMSASGATLATNISFENVALTTTSLQDILYLDSATNVTFKSVQFKGPASNPAAPTIVHAAIKLNAFVTSPDNIIFDSCKFANLEYAIVSDVKSANVRINNSLFTNLYGGLLLGQNSASAATAPSNFRITNSVFNGIGYRAIDSFAYTSGIVSCGNSYYNVSNNYTSDATPFDNIINFLSDGNYSINDYFGDTSSTRNVVFNDTKSVVLQANVGLAMGTATVGTGNKTTLAGSTLTATSTGIALPAAGVMNYVIENESNLYGTLTFAGSTWTDSFVHDPATDTDITFSIVGNTLYFTNSGISALNLRYNINHF